jgi:hypothetical protein
MTNECGCPYGNCDCDVVQHQPVQEVKKEALYKIRDKRTGLYSTGGYSPNWTKKGKTWTNIGHVKNHIRQLNRLDKVDDWELVELAFVEVGRRPLRQVADTVRPRRRS